MYYYFMNVTFFLSPVTLRWFFTAGMSCCVHKPARKASQGTSYLNTCTMLQIAPLVLKVLLEDRL
jgi:hypothetical protein